MAICWPSAQLAAAQSLYADLHSGKPYHNGSPDRFKNPSCWAEDRSRAFPFHYTDGASMWLADEDLPGPDFLSWG